MALLRQYPSAAPTVKRRLSLRTRPPIRRKRAVPHLAAERRLRVDLHNGASTFAFSMSIATTDFSNVVFIAAAAVAALFLAGVGYFLVRRVRRWMQGDVRPRAFTLHELRQMRESGQLSPREYELLRRSTISSVMSPIASGDPDQRTGARDAASDLGSSDPRQRDDADDDSGNRRDGGD